MMLRANVGDVYYFFEAASGEPCSPCPCALKVSGNSYEQKAISSRWHPSGKCCRPRNALSPMYKKKNPTKGQG